MKINFPFDETISRLVIFIPSGNKDNKKGMKINLQNVLV